EREEGDGGRWRAHVAKKEPDRVATAVAVDQGGELRDDVGGNARAAVVDDERRFVERQLRDLAALARRFERERRPRGDPPQVNGSAGSVDQRLQVFDLALDGIRLRVFAFAAATSVVRVHGDVLREQPRERRAWAHRAIAEGTVDQDQWRPLPAPLEGDRRAVA